MPAEVYEEPFEWTIDRLEAEPLTPASQRRHKSAFPYPFLRTTGETQSITFRALVLENPFLKVTVLPELGGRIAGILDKRTGIELLPQGERAPLEEGGPRGLRLHHGLLVQLAPERLTELGPVEYSFDDPADEHSPAGVFLSELCSGTGLSVTWHVSLPPDAAEIRLETRIFNRDLRWQDHNSGIQLYLDAEALGAPGAVSLYSQERQAGISLLYDPAVIEAALQDDDRFYLRRFEAASEPLGPRQLDTWSVRIVPHSGLSTAEAAGEVSGVSLRDGRLQVQSARRLPDHKLVLLTRDGRTLESPADLYPERLLEMDLTSLPSEPEALVLLAPDGTEVLRWQGRPGVFRSSSLSSAAFRQLNPREQLFSDAVTAVRRGEAPAEALKKAEFEPAVRAASLVAQSMISFRKRDFAEAHAQLDDALMFNAEDHLAWWQKAVASRLQGQDDPDRSELLNAHFLAPLDPVLRAESFLGQPSASKEPSPLVKPLAENPDLLVEVAVLLFELGLYDELSRWVDECLRHRQVPMLRYLLAEALLAHSRMEVEAAEHMRAAAQAPVNPPYPWRETEIRILAKLHQRFPKEGRIKELLELAAWAGDR